MFEASDRATALEGFTLMVIWTCCAYGGDLHSLPQPPPARIPTYTVRDLGVLDGYTQSWPTGLNDHGDAVGYAHRFTFTPGGLLVEDQACLFKDGQVFSLGLSPSNSRANAINNHGQIVGISDDAFAFLWDNGTITWLGSLIPDGLSEATDINDLGQIVGRAGVVDASYWHPFLWENGVMTDLGTLPGNFRDWKATAINNQSQIVGTFKEAWPPPFRTHAFTWQLVIMAELPGLSVFHTIATDIDDSGVVVGNSDGSAVRWAGGRLQYLVDPPYPLGGTVTATNNHGQVVGYGDALRQNQILFRLITLIPPVSSFELEVAVDINNAGQILCRAIGPGPQVFYSTLLTPIDCDINADGTITLDDFQGLPGCMMGPQPDVIARCARFDFDGDFDVDIVDYRSFDLALQLP